MTILVADSWTVQPLEYYPEELWVGTYDQQVTSLVDGVLTLCKGAVDVFHSQS